MVHASYAYDRDMPRVCRTNMNDKGRYTWTHPLLCNDSETEVKELSRNIEESHDKNQTMELKAQLL